MDYIYMDNFRGFEDTIIPLRQANFLVGENSTGKTSFLALLNLLNNANFVFRQDFNCDQYEFGGYSDIVSASAQNKREFRIGLCRHTEKEKRSFPRCILMHFREREGLPLLYKFTMAEDNWVGTAIVDEKIGKYRIDELKTVCANRNDAAHFLRCVAKYAQDKSLHFKDIPKNLKFYEIDKLIGLSLYGFTNILKTLAPSPHRSHKDFRILPLTYGVVGLAPIRTKPKRIYDGYAKPFNPEGEHTPHLLRKYLTKTKGLGKVLDTFGKESGLFQHIGIKKFGKEQPAPFEVDITLGNKPLGINSVGYGVSQVLPVVVEFILRGKGTWFSIQQPEIHLHPKAQAILGDVFYRVARADNKTLFVETHSDYLIDRFRYSLGNSKKKISTQIMYFEKSKGKNKISIIPIHESGKYPSEQPAEFRRFFINESIRNLEI